MLTDLGKISGVPSFLVKTYCVFHVLCSYKIYEDYQGFAAERPEELARAIQRGIPATLRGMMWQHMYVFLYPIA